MVQVYNGSIMVFRVETGELIAEFREQPEEYCSIVILCPDLPEPETVTSAAWSPDGNIITLGLKDGRILLRDAKTGEKLRYLVGHNDEVGYLEWSRDGMLLISFSEDGTTLVWDMSE
jgi:WD40 repeat protein